MSRKSTGVPSGHWTRPGGKIAADEELIDDGLALFRIEIYMSAPPSFEIEIAGRFRSNSD
jgi:hypothetical protein